MASSPLYDHILELFECRPRRMTYEVMCAELPDLGFTPAWFTIFRQRRMKEPKLYQFEALHEYLTGKPIV